jgi:hypothetical protein
MSQLEAIRMLHIVQIVMWGVAETPQLFVEEEKARTAYVECVKKHWTKRYSAYCEHHGLNEDSFASAHAFVSKIDVSEKSHIHYWTLDADEAGLGDSKSPLSGEEMEEVRHVAEGLVAIKTGLLQLLEDLSDLTDRFSRTRLSPTEPRTAESPESIAPSPSPAWQEISESDPSTYKTPEWKAFVGTVMRLGSGMGNEFYLLRREDWRQDVYSNRTSLEYWDWVADRITQYKERAKNGNYSVIQDPEGTGCYRFIDQEGIASKDCGDSEWEAWCAAGLDLKAKCRETGG